MQWTNEQQKIIDFRGGDLLVSASAGSGKTTTMLGRIMRLIEEGYSLKNMLVSTFTVSAAEDMRVKLDKKLREKYEMTGDRRFLVELERLPSADICTLHKWCQKIVRKYFYVTGDDPAFEIAEESESHRWRSEAIEKAIAEASQKPEYADFQLRYMRKRTDNPIRSIIKEVMFFVDSQPDAEEWLAHGASAYDNPDYCRAILSDLLSEEYASIMNEIDVLEGVAKNLNLVKAPLLLDELRANVNGTGIEKYTRAVGITQIKEEFDGLKKRISAYLARINEVATARDEEAGRDAKILLSITARALEIYSAEKAERGRLDFADLERKAKIILASDVGEEVRKTLTHVFIDEYQDINPLQESIINLVGKDNLFFVGDIKQSIYAFRNCSPDAFAYKHGELSLKGATVELNRNYRSKRGILAFTNAVFSRIMTEKFGKVDYAGTARFYTEGEGNDGSVEIIRLPKVPASRDKVYFDEVYSVKNHNLELKERSMEVEAEAVVEKIVTLLGSGNYEYKDVVVLVRRRSGISEIIARDLRNVGIPVSVSAKLGITEGRTNNVLLSYLRLIDNFRDDVSLVGVMRSPIGGFTDEELVKIRKKHGAKKPFYACVAEDDSEKVKDFLGDVQKYSELSGVLTVGELAGRITSDKKLFHTAMSDTLGLVKSESLGKLMESLSGYNGTLSEYLEYIEVSEPKDEAPPEVNSVRIMTIHASKGLEFPIVMMCGLGSPFHNDSKNKVIPDGKLGLALASKVAETGETLPSLPLLVARRKKRIADLEEEMRVLYVAMTRAQDKLVLFLPNKEQKNKLPEECVSYADWIYPTAVSHGMKEAGEELPNDFTISEPQSLSEEKLNELRNMLALSFETNTYDIKKSVTGLLTEGEEGKEVTIAPLLPDDYDGEDKQTAMDRGTAFHACLEVLDFETPFPEQLCALKEVPNFDLVDKNKLEKAYDAISARAKGGKLYREQPFILKAESLPGAEDGGVVQGVIDLLILRDGEAEIIDYKSGFLTDARKQKYNKQLDLYAIAVEKLLGIPVTQKSIYLIDMKKFM